MKVTVHVPLFSSSHDTLRAYPITAYYRNAQCDGAAVHNFLIKRHRIKDSTPSIVTRKQIKGVLMVVAIVTAMDLLQLPASVS